MRQRQRGQLPTTHIAVGWPMYGFVSAKKRSKMGLTIGRFNNSSEGTPAWREAQRATPYDTSQLGGE